MAAAEHHMPQLQSVCIHFGCAGVERMQIFEGLRVSALQGRDCSGLVILAMLDFALCPCSRLKAFALRLHILRASIEFCGS